MSNPDLTFENRTVAMSGDYPARDLFLKCAKVEEGLSVMTEATVEFLCKDRGLNLKDVVGYKMNVTVQTADGSVRKFLGTCVSAEFLGVYQGFGHFSAEVRPWFWFLTLRHDNRIFQDKSVVEIIRDVLSAAGFSDYQIDVDESSYKKRVYCVQYRESDYAFLCRLMEEEGIYFFFTHEGAREKLVFADGIGAHRPAPQGPSFDFHFREEDYRRKTDHVFEWAAIEQVTTGKIALTDYDFERPQADLKKLKAMPKGSHTQTQLELYDYPGHYRKEDIGDGYARALMESLAVKHQRWSGAANVRTLGVGQVFQLKGHPRNRDTNEFLLTRATHYVQIETEFEERRTGSLSDRAMLFPFNDEAYRIVFEAIPKTVQFRAPKATPWPAIAGLHTAVVVGEPGREIHTDQYGRIKVKFHWDRVNAKDDKASCWVRTVMPWTGKNWGMIAIPRVGQEVVIQFEEGDPDRPICTGMLYNADTMPPYALPGDKTMSGVKTRSTEQGTDANYNELVFEDKKGSEFIRMHAEKDYFLTVENDAVVDIGQSKKDKGDLTQTIHRNKTVTLKTGDLSTTVEEGHETRSIHLHQSTDIGDYRSVNIGTNDDLNVSDNRTMTVGGDVSETVSGNQSETISQNLSIDVGSDITISAGNNIAISAGSEITLTVGSSKITMNASGVTVTGVMVTVDGKQMTEVKGGLSVIVKGQTVMIN